MHYLDHAAATPLRPEAREAMEPYLGADFANPSGLHSASRRAKSAVEEARERIAAILGAAHPLDVVFTSGGTEAANLGILGPLLAAGPGSRLVTTAIEHEAVLATAAMVERIGCLTTVVGVDGLGRVDPGDVAMAVDAVTRVVSVMAANNETGVIQPISKVAEAVRSLEGNILIHTDAVQAVVSETIQIAGLGVDALSLSGHKVGGPKGVGALVVGRDVDLEPTVLGGGQELGRRSGTLNVAGIVGMAAALEAVARDRDRFREVVGAQRDAFEEVLIRRVPDVAVTGAGIDRLVQHSHARIPGISAETLLIRLDAAGVAASSGSACQSGATTPSHVLTAMGMTDAQARQCVRFTFGWTARLGDGAAAAAVVADVIEALR